MKRKISRLFGLLLALGVSVGSTAKAAGEFCRVTVSHSMTQNIVQKDLVYRNIADAFMNSVVACQGQHTNLKSELTAACRAKGGAKAQIAVQYITRTHARTLAVYSAFCQDLAPDLYVCTRWDKTTNKWVPTNDPSCYGGGDVGGDPGGSGGGDYGGGGP